EELARFIENDTADASNKMAAQLLMNAVNDCPLLNLIEPVDLMAALTLETNSSLTASDLRLYMTGLSLFHDAWRVDAIASLFELLDLAGMNQAEGQIELELIIGRLARHIRTQGLK